MLLVEPITKAFVSSIKDFAESHFIPVVRFRKGERSASSFNRPRLC